MFSRANIMFSMVTACADWRLSENAMPTAENKRSTDAEVTISGDLWSDGGMGLFGIYAHGITETWVLEKKLIALVACESKVCLPHPFA